MSKLIIKTNSLKGYSKVIDTLVRKGFSEAPSILPISPNENYVQIEYDYYLYNRTTKQIAEMMGFIEAEKIKIN